MMVIHGKSKADVKVSGAVTFYRRDVFEPLMEHRDDPEAEFRRFTDARDTSIKELEAEYEIALEKAGEEAAGIFEIQKQMIEDEDFSDLVAGIIRSQQCCAEFAVKCASKTFSDLLRFSGSEYMSQRSEDIFFISDRLIRKLAGVEKRLGHYNKEVIVCADTLSSSDILLMQSPFIVAICVKRDLEMSHLALLAQGLGIPLISDLGDKLDRHLDGMQATADCTTGMLIIEN
ncbi:MAG: hypothetical protein IKR76_07335 [Ruminococcus sp.]|nr:hypothetical protein [Ruminococcus sp.]